MYKVDFETLERSSAAVWSEILGTSRLVETINAGSITRELFALYMLETYQYTRHNARNQALVGVRTFELPAKYIGYCFKHAKEETGHEQMALNDVLALGFKLPEVDSLKPLPATETLIAYLYWISLQGNPIQRLGYSYWAENCYRYVNPIIGNIQRSLALKDNQLTFFIAHSHIDDKHAKEVAHMIAEYCRSEDDFQDILRVMETSLRLTGRILENVYDEYERALQGAPSPYSFLMASRPGQDQKAREASVELAKQARKAKRAVAASANLVQT